MSSQFLESKRFLVRFGGDYELNVDLTYVILFALFVCVLFQYFTEAKSASALVIGDNTEWVRRIALRNFFLFAATGLIASLVANDQWFHVIVLQSLFWGILGWNLTLQSRTTESKLAALFVTCGALFFRVLNGTVSSGWWVALVIYAMVAVTVKNLRGPASTAPLLLLPGASLVAITYMAVMVHEIAKGRALLTDEKNETLSEFVTKLREGIQDPKVKALLDAGLADGRIGDDQIRVSHKRIAAGDLLPTQTQIDLDKSVGYYLDTPAEKTDMLSLVKNSVSGETQTSKAPPVTVATSGTKVYIIDGHHRWSQQLIFGGPNNLLDCYVIESAESGINDPVKVLKIVQVAIAASIGRIPVATVNTENDVFAMDATAIRSYYTKAVSGPSPKLNWVANYSKIAEIVPTKDAVEWLTGETNKVLSKKQALGDLPRDAMPQLDVVTDARDKLVRLAYGRVNWAQPF